MLRRVSMMLILLAGCLVHGCSADHPPLQRFECIEPHMGVQARIVVYAENVQAAASAGQAAMREIGRLDRMMSDYRAESELNRLNAAAGLAPMRVSAELFEVIARSIEIAEMTDGAFDITIGPVVALWREAKQSGRVPNDEQLQAAHALVDWRNVAIDHGQRTIRLARRGMRLDLGGIGQGFACDCAAEVLRAHGIDRYLIDIGGDIVAGAPPPAPLTLLPPRAGWSIAIVAGEAPPIEIELAHAAITTSGDAELFLELEGTRHSHIIDPGAGIGLTQRLAVTVIAPDGATADALATAISVLAPEQGARLVESQAGVSARIVFEREGEQSVITTRDFPIP